MASNYQDPMLDMFIFETEQLLEQLEQIIINSEFSNYYKEDTINEIFRIMHTVKGSSAMMCFNNISSVTHSIEDLFHFMRENKNLKYDSAKLSDIVLSSVDFIKDEVRIIKDGGFPDGDASGIISEISGILSMIKDSNGSLDLNESIKRAERKKESDDFQNSLPNKENPMQKSKFKAVVYFDDGCEMESIRAYALFHGLEKFAEVEKYSPEDIDSSEISDEIIKNEGFQIWFKTDITYDEIHSFFSKTIFLKDLELTEIKSKQFNQENDGKIRPNYTEAVGNTKDGSIQPVPSHQSIISVNVVKLDKLMDLVGELVISEAMVTQNPDLKGVALDSFHKAAIQHHKIINELQDVAMSIRMVPLTATFQKMKRIIRDMCKKLNKNVILEITGEETEVDKNIIEHIADPLMHIIRNSIDHGIEAADERKGKGKPEAGKVTLEAKNTGGDVLITVRDDGKGLEREKILSRAKEKGLLNRAEHELSDKEIYSLIFLPGFSTKDSTTEYSGRGVGMNVVTENISAVGGMASVDSKPDKGTSITLKIPLTLAIIDGMTIEVGDSRYTIPIISIKESFKAKEEDIVTDPDGNEMIMIRGASYSVLRLYKLFKIKNGIENINDGIMIMIESEGKSFCVFADRLIGEQQVVVKALPEYIKNLKRVKGVIGCTLLGDGSISLILDIADLTEINYEGR